MWSTRFDPWVLTSPCPLPLRLEKLARRRAKAVHVPTVARCAAHVPLVFVVVRRDVVATVVARTDVVLALFLLMLVQILRLLVLDLPLFVLFDVFLPNLWRF